MKKSVKSSPSSSRRSQRPTTSSPAEPINSEPVAKRRSAPDPWVWIEGLSEKGDGSEQWVPLYCFRWATDLFRARSTLRYILGMNEMPRELSGFSDFRLSELPPEAPDSTEEPLEGPQRPSNEVGATEHRDRPTRRSVAPTEAKTTGPSTKKARCRDAFDARKSNRCIKRVEHAGKHRDLHGHEWG